jgi:hypothetical protein
MKIAITGVAVALLIAATPSYAVQFNAGVLNKRCQTNTVEAQAQCGGYIIGVLNGIEIADGFDQLPRAQRDAALRGDFTGVGDDPPHTIVCVPASETPVQFVNKVTSMLAAQLKQFPDDADFTSAVAVSSILLHLYPCSRTPRH